MTPYYEKDGIVLYHGDCRDVLPTLENKSIELCLTDPPYNLGINYGSRVDDRMKCYAEWCQEWFSQCIRVASIVAFTPGIANVSLWYVLKKPTWTIAWHKPACMGRCPVGFNNWEPVLLWGKPNGKASADVVVAPIIPDSEVEGHPCPKPLLWATKLLAILSGGGVVLDPFSGSGTVLRAAKDACLSAIGIEIEEKYCEIAARRLDQGVLPFSVDEKEHAQKQGVFEGF